MLRSLGINLSLFGSAVLGIWVCLEIGFAVGAPQIPIREPLMYAPHSVLRYVPNPGTSWRYRTTEFDTQVAFNVHGFRNIERPLEKPAGTFRILCLGDSFTLGAEVAMEDSYAYILEQLLNERAASRGDSVRFEVMNGGVGGYGTFQELLFLQEFGMVHNPDLILAQFYSNDVRDNMKYQEFWNTVYPDSSIFLSTSSVFADILALLEDHSHVYHFFRSRFNILKSVLGFKVLTDFDDLMVMAPEPSSEIEKGWELTRKLFLKIWDLARANQAGFAIMVVPNKAQVGQNEPPDAWIEEQKLDMTKPIRILREFGLQNRIPVLDLLPDLQSASETQALYYDWDGHWNAFGNRAAAATIVEFLEAEALVP